MKTYTVILTRPITESVVVTVEAENENQAEDTALSMADTVKGWEVDDYIPDDIPFVSDIEEDS